MTTWYNIIEFLGQIGDNIQGLISCIPDFIRPLCFCAFIVSVVYLIAGRN